jgi:hypothetical protein
MSTSFDGLCLGLSVLAEDADEAVAVVLPAIPFMNDKSKFMEIDGIFLEFDEDEELLIGDLSVPVLPDVIEAILNRFILLQIYTVSCSRQV